MKNFALACFLVLTFASFCGAQSTDKKQQEGRLLTILQESRKQLGAKGISAAIIDRDQKQWLGVAGELADKKPMTKDAAFQIGSITKTYTAALIMRLVDQKKLSLDSKIEKWYPELPHAKQITLRQILNHTSGLNDLFQSSGFTRGLYFQPTKKWTIDELLGKVGKPEFEPGKGWAYSSTGYLALAGVAEKETGLSYSKLLRKEFLAPLNLKRTYVGGIEKVPEPVVHAFIDINGDKKDDDLSAFLPMTGTLTAFGGAGGIVASPADVARWLHALMNNQVVDIKKMQQWVDRTDGNQHGLGLLRIKIQNVHLTGHRGNSGGFSCTAWHAPDSGLTLVVCTNKNGIHLTSVVEKLIKELLPANAKSGQD